MCVHVNSAADMELPQLSLKALIGEEEEKKEGEEGTDGSDTRSVATSSRFNFARSCVASGHNSGTPRSTSPDSAAFVTRIVPFIIATGQRVRREPHACCPRHAVLTPRSTCTHVGKSVPSAHRVGCPLRPCLGKNRKRGHPSASQRCMPNAPHRTSRTSPFVKRKRDR